jgi:hypothetical protein
MHNNNNSASLINILRPLILFLQSQKRRLLYVFLGILLFFTTKHVIIFLAPAGYSKQKCMTSLYEIRKSEELIRIFTLVAKMHNFTWWIDYGALLGIVRGGSLIPYDKDIDATCLDEDMYKLHSLEPHLQKFGVKKLGSTFVWAEDYDRMLNGQHEEVASKLEFYPVVPTEEGYVLRPDILPHINAKSIGGRIWWFLLRWTGVAFHRKENVFPLSEVQMKRFIPPKRTKMVKNKETGVEEEVEIDDEDDEKDETRMLQKQQANRRDELEMHEVDESDR